MTSHLNGIGILGGTFDPIHLGHTQSAQIVATQLKLEKVLLIPAHISPFISECLICLSLSNGLYARPNFKLTN